MRGPFLRLKIKKHSLLRFIHNDFMLIHCKNPHEIIGSSYEK